VRSFADLQNTLSDSLDSLCGSYIFVCLLTTCLYTILGMVSGQLRQMLVHFQEQRAIPEEFSIWAIGQLDERVMVMALANAHDAEVLVQILSFKGGTFASLIQAIEDMHQNEQIVILQHIVAKLRAIYFTRRAARYASQRGVSRSGRSLAIRVGS
jgi:hypothetical protein